MHRVSAAITVFVAALAVLALSVSTSSQERRSEGLAVETVGGREAAAGEVLVKFQSAPQRAQLSQLESDADAHELHPVGRSRVYRVASRTRSAAALVASLTRRRDLAYVEPNYVVHAFQGPNDPFFPALWGIYNFGQPVNGRPGGTVGADSHAAEAWSLALGSASNVVAIIDSGVDYMHPDIAANMWSAPSAFTVTIGGIAITCQAGTHGYNAIARTCDPMDDHNHGTHVAGTIGAVPHNGIGVIGVSPIASMMGLKFLNGSGSGTVADAIDAIEFALQAKRIFAATGGANVRVLSNSWGGGDFSQALLDQIHEAASEEMLFVAAAGNNGLPNDIIPLYPASYAAPNVVAVAATTNTDTRAFFSNYGRNTVHLGAPGDNILSTIRGGSYTFMSGTSMAAPHVTGSASLVLSQCTLSMPDLKTVLLDSVDAIPSMATTTISGGRLNVRRAIESCSQLPETPVNVTATGGDAQVRVAWSEAVGAAGYRVKRSTVSGGPYTTVASNLKSLQFTDLGLTNGTTYFYVVSATNILGESTASAEVSATPKFPPDLVVSAFTAPATVLPGQSVTISVTTRNQGAGFADPTTTRFYMSTNTTVDANDTLLPEVHAVPALAPAAVSAVSMSVTLPPSLQPGAYYLVAKADAGDVVTEKSETNNSTARAMSSGPDLIMTALDMPAVVAPGATLTASYTIQNKGNTGAALSVLELFWSANTSLEAADAFLARIDVAPLAPTGTASGQLSFVAPADAALGTYYVIARADSSNVVTESSETNNTMRATVRVGGDLVVSDLSAPASVGAGASFVMIDTTKNSGSVGVDQSGTQFYLSPDAVLSASDQLLGGRAVPALAAGGTSTASTTLAVPGGTASGLYYLFAKADAANGVAETQESNNTAIRSVRVGPDLVASISSVTTPVTAGSTTVVRESITNNGGGDAGASTVKFYLSKNSALDASDVTLAETRAVDALPPGGSSAGVTSVTVPAGTAPGVYYLIAQADGFAAVAESAESNNTHARTFRVE